MELRTCIKNNWILALNQTEMTFCVTFTQNIHICIKKAEPSLSVWKYFVSWFIVFMYMYWTTEVVSLTAVSVNKVWTLCESKNRMQTSSVRLRVLLPSVCYARFFSHRKLCPWSAWKHIISTLVFTSLTLLHHYVALCIKLTWKSTCLFKFSWAWTQPGNKLIVRQFLQCKFGRLEWEELC